MVAARRGVELGPMERRHVADGGDSVELTLDQTTLALTVNSTSPYTHCCLRALCVVSGDGRTGRFPSKFDTTPSWCLPNGSTRFWSSVE
ncbi:hypothetical protein M0R45_033091 [Rubus argutus]|uniref:Uncharacterized protein n=1 Tax=Rubus argutus TaxID=59490 RepID=A0AAW1WKP1_RUBAR